MPNRYIREGFLDSEAVQRVDELCQMLFVRLLLVADDFGRFDGRVDVIARKCWPAGKDPGEMVILERLTKLTEANLVVAYETGGKPFIYIRNFKQRTRATKSKYPDPPPASEANDGQTPDRCQADAGQVSGKWRAADSHPQAVSGSVSISYSGSARGHTSDNPTSTPRAAAHSLARTQAQLAEQAEAARKALPPHEPIPAAAAKFVKRRASKFDDEPDSTPSP